MNQWEVFEKWFIGEQGTPYDGMYSFALAAWQAAQQAQWQPIETAPMDGKPILCGWDSGVEPCVCYWCEVVDGWSGWHGYPEFDEQPTKWMPLPPEPKL